MLNHSTNTFTMTAVVAAIVAASSGCLLQWNQPDISLLAQQSKEMEDYKNGSGRPMLIYNHAAAHVEMTMKQERAVNIASIKMQLRYERIERSFGDNSQGFPEAKCNYVKRLANAVCRLPFVDNLTTYNDDDETIDTMLRLSNGLKLRISQFIDEDIEAPVVFSIHRKKILLVSDELPIDEIVDKLMPLLRRNSEVSHA